MDIAFKVKMNEKLFIRDPEGTETGQNIVRQSLSLFLELGYEQFTFKKLAVTIGCTEATVYRYFENKHKLLIYLIDFYWSFVEFQLVFATNNMQNGLDKIKKLIEVLVWEKDGEADMTWLNFEELNLLAIVEGSKTYLCKEVDIDNSEKFFQPYKDLCDRIAGLLTEFNPGYKFSRSLASTIVETSHMQYYYMHHLPRLCNFSDKKNVGEIRLFLEGIVLGALSH